MTDWTRKAAESSQWPICSGSAEYALNHGDGVFDSFFPFVILLIEDIVVLCLVNQAKVLTLGKK